jgi:hypothetical protein
LKALLVKQKEKLLSLRKIFVLFDYIEEQNNVDNTGKIGRAIEFLVRSAGLYWAYADTYTAVDDFLGVQQGHYLFFLLY